MFQHRLMAPPARIFNVPILIATHHNQPVVTIAGTAGANRGRATWAHNPATAIEVAFERCPGAATSVVHKPRTCQGRIVDNQWRPRLNQPNHFARVLVQQEVLLAERLDGPVVRVFLASRLLAPHFTGSMGGDIP